MLQSLGCTVVPEGVLMKGMWACADQLRKALANN